MKKILLALTCAALMLGCGDEPSDNPRSDGGRRDAGGASTDCPDTLACVDACSSDACVESCLDDATPTALTQIEAIVSCTTLNQCGEDDACIEEHCGTVVALCFDIEIIRDGGADASDDASSDPFPSRIEGTSRDFMPIAGTVTFDSNATVVFVRDDAAGQAQGYPISQIAFYRMESIEYRAVESGSDGTCDHAADETETFMNPTAFENNLVIERTPNDDGLYPYVVSTSFSVIHPGGVTVTCPSPLPSSTAAFDASHHISQGIGMTHLTDGETFVSTVTIGPRQLSWSLHAAD